MVVLITSGLCVDFECIFDGKWCGWIDFGTKVVFCRLANGSRHFWWWDCTFYLPRKSPFLAIKHPAVHLHSNYISSSETKWISPPLIRCGRADSLRPCWRVAAVLTRCGRAVKTGHNPSQPGATGRNRAQPGATGRNPSQIEKVMHGRFLQ